MQDCEICSEHFDPKAVMSVGIHPRNVRTTTLASTVVPRKSLPAPGSRAPGIADGEEEVAIPRGGLLTPLPIGTPAIQAGTPGRLPGTPGRPRGPMQAQQPQPQPAQNQPSTRCRWEDADIGDSSSESTWNPKVSDPSSSQVGKATPRSSDLEDEEQQEVELVDDSISLEELGLIQIK